MMDTIVLFAAWLAFVCSVLSVIIEPFFIGRDRKPTDGVSYLSTLFSMAVIILMAGRIFGWW